MPHATASSSSCLLLSLDCPKEKEGSPITANEPTSQQPLPEVLCMQHQLSPPSFFSCLSWALNPLFHRDWSFRNWGRVPPPLLHNRTQRTDRNNSSPPSLPPFSPLLWHEIEKKGRAKTLLPRSTFDDGTRQQPTNREEWQKITVGITSPSLLKGESDCQLFI